MKKSFNSALVKSYVSVARLQGSKETPAVSSDEEWLKELGIIKPTKE